MSLSFMYLWITKQSGLGFSGKAVEGLVSPQRSLYTYVGTEKCTKSDASGYKPASFLH